MRAMPTAIDSHGGLNLSPLCTFYNIILSPLLIYYSFHTSFIDFSLSATCSSSGVISKNFNKGALGAMSESRCGLFAAMPIFLNMET